MPRPILRLTKELREAKEFPDPDIHLELYNQACHGRVNVGGASGWSADGSDIFMWVAVLKGPPGTPFEGGEYKMLLRVPSDYPMLPPSAKFITKVFHPNVHFNTGDVCLDILKSRWSPAWTLSSVCRAVLNLLAEPESDSPFNCDAGNLVRDGDMEAYNSVVRMYAIMDAGAPRFKD